jgi:hypothetical protein
VAVGDDESAVDDGDAGAIGDEKLAVGSEDEGVSDAVAGDADVGDEELGVAGVQTEYEAVESGDDGSSGQVDEDSGDEAETVASGDSDEGEGELEVAGGNYAGIGDA